MSMKLKTFFGIVLGLALVMVLLPEMSLTAYADGISVELKGVEITSQTSGEGWSYDSGNNTLTLNNYNSGNYSGQVIKKTGGGDLNIILNGTNTLTSTGGGVSCIFCAGGGSYTISGDGTLNVNSQGSGIWANGNSLTINGGTVKIQGSTGMDLSYCPLIIDGGIVTTEGYRGLVGSLQINSGKITATGTGSSGWAMEITKASGLSVSGGEIEANGGQDGINIRDEAKMNVNGGTVKVSGETGIHKDNEWNTLTIGGGYLTVTGKTKAIDALVINSVTGTGWTNMAGTEGQADITTSTGGQMLGSYKKVQFPAPEKAVVKKAPAANTLTYNGKPQELVTAGKAEGGEMQYALGTDSTTAPTSGWEASIPTGVDAKDYYVWYKAVGDNSHSDSEAKVVTVTIKKKGEAHTHTFKLVDAKEPTCTEDGYKEHYECPECGAWFEDGTGASEITDKSGYIIGAIGHKWDDGVVTKEATYDETGIKTFTCENDPSHTKEEVIPMKEYRESDTDNSDGSSGGGSGKNSGSVSKQSIDVNGNTISSNHQAETGVPASDVGGRWANSANADIWTYTKSDGTLAKSEWMSLDYNGLRYWYYFNEDGIMLTNWFDYNGERFYLMPEKDGWRGRMATGWKNIDNKWYYFDIVPGSTQGKLYRGAITPDGHVVGADGAWNGVGETPVGQE